MTELTKILLKSNIAESELEKLAGMEWKAQDAQGTDALFYRLNSEDPAALEKMKERLRRSSYGVLFLNAPKDYGLRDCFALEEENFFLLRKLLADRFYPLPRRKLIAITGTNGKTTTVDLIRQLALLNNRTVLTIGTLGVYLNEMKIDDFSLTSPDFIDLRKALYKYKDSYEICALEASSHAIEQKRLFGIGFDSLGWTSFSQDHLDYHGSMENYFQAKKSLSNAEGSKFIVSARSKELAERLGGSAAQAQENKRPCSEFFKSAFNMVNLDVAVGCLRQAGIDVEEKSLDRLIPPPGRYNVTCFKEQIAVIDFAHTPDALENICSELKASYPDKDLVCVFGCGGDRDRSKRPLMGKAAAKYCDYIVLTTDNPRFENPLKIMEDVEPGLEKVKYRKEVDRKKAIRHAVEKFPEAVILIAGKGHEPYLDVGGKKLPYSDQEELNRIYKNDNP